MSDLAIGVRLAGSQLESLGQALVSRVGALELWTALLLAGAIALDRALARRARASWRIVLYAPVALRILVPLDWTVHVATTPRIAGFLAPLARIGARPDAGLAGWHAPSWYALAAVVYGAGVILLAARAVAARLRLERALAGARPVADVPAGVPCPVVEHDHLGPMAVGLLAPRIVLPRRLLDAGADEALDCVLRHETAHLRRGDAWLSAAMQLLAIAAWPVVPLWIAVGRVRNLVELACDEAALAGSDAGERRRYGHALLDVAEWRWLGNGPLGAGELHFGSTLRARIEALAVQRHWPPAAQMLVLAAAPVVLLAACSGSASLPAPAGGPDNEGYGYRYESDSPKVAAGSPAPDVAKAHADPGRIPPETIQAIVRSHFGAFRACYEAGQKKDPKLAGRVTVHFTIAMDGTTRDAGDEGSTIADTEVVSCVVGGFRQLTYPKPVGGEVTVVYPIEFSPGD